MLLPILAFFKKDVLISPMQKFLVLVNSPIAGGTWIHKHRCQVPVEMALVAKMSMWSRQIQHSRFGVVFLPGEASGEKGGVP